MVATHQRRLSMASCNPLVDARTSSKTKSVRIFMSLPTESRSDVTSSRRGPWADCIAAWMSSVVALGDAGFAVTSRPRLPSSSTQTTASRTV